MYISVNNGKTIFATHLIKANIDKEIRMELPFQIETEGVVCYSAEEVEKVKIILDKLKIEYTIETIIFDEKQKEKTNNIKYTSRSEAIKHIQEDAEPQSQVIPNIKKINDIVGKKSVDLEIENFELKSENNMLGSEIVNLELRLLKLEGGQSK
jgi:hypothetical protein